MGSTELEEAAAAAALTVNQMPLSEIDLVMRTLVQWQCDQELALIKRRWPAAESGRLTAHREKTTQPRDAV